MNPQSEFVYDVIASNYARDGEPPVVLSQGLEVRPTFVGHRVRITRYYDDALGVVAQDGYLDVGQYEFVSIVTRRVEEAPCESPCGSPLPSPEPTPPKRAEYSGLLDALSDLLKRGDSSRAR